MGINTEKSPEYKEAALRAYTAWKAYDDWNRAMPNEFSNDIQKLMHDPQEVKRAALALFLQEKAKNV